MVLEPENDPVKITAYIFHVNDTEKIKYDNIY